MLDETWDKSRFRVANEDSYTLNLPTSFSSQVDTFLTSCARAIAKFEIAIDDKIFIDELELNSGIRAVEGSVSNIETMLETIFNWNNALKDNERVSISGAEYWGLVSNLTTIFELLSMNSETTSVKVRLYGTIYESNISYLQQLFRDNRFLTTREWVVSPLYKEIKRCREEELARPEYNF